MDLARKEGHEDVVALLTAWNRGSRGSGEMDTLCDEEATVQDVRLAEKLNFTYTVSDEPSDEQGIAVVRVCVDKDGTPREANILEMTIDLLQMFFVNDLLKTVTGHHFELASPPQGSVCAWLSVPVKIVVKGVSFERIIPHLSRRD